MRDEVDFGNRGGAAEAPAPGRLPWEQGEWLNPPARFAIDGDALEVVTDGGTDFWRETHYGFVRDGGHVLGFPAGGSFTAQVRVRGRFEELYDQAGIMVRVDERRWVKAGIEMSDGEAMLGSVLTDGRSDWATGRYGGDPSDFRMRATVDAGVLRLQVSADGVRWPLVRLSPFAVADRYLVGPFACTPEREGLRVSFSEFRLGPPLGRALHDLG